MRTETYTQKPQNHIQLCLAIHHMIQHFVHELNIKLVTPIAKIDPQHNSTVNSHNSHTMHTTISPLIHTIRSTKIHDQTESYIQSQSIRNSQTEKHTKELP